MIGARLFGAASALIALVMLCGFAPDDKAIWRPPGPDPEMDQARADARQTLPKFWVQFDKHSRGFGDPTVKVGYPTQHGGTEFLWVAVDAHQGSSVSGEILNEPEDVPSVHRGQKVAISQSQIVDWSYSRAGVWYGQYTTRVVIKHLKPGSHWSEGVVLAPAALEPGSY